MTRKDYVLIAEVFSKTARNVWNSDGVDNIIEDDVRSAVRDIVEATADALARDNPRFDRGRFIKAAYA